MLMRTSTFHVAPIPTMENNKRRQNARRHMYDKSEATYTWVVVSSNKQRSMVVLCVCYCVIIVSSWFRSRLSLLTIRRLNRPLSVMKRIINKRRQKKHNIKRHDVFMKRTIENNNKRQAQQNADNIVFIKVRN